MLPTAQACWRYLARWWDLSNPKGNNLTLLGVEAAARFLPTLTARLEGSGELFAAPLDKRPVKRFYHSWHTSIDMWHEHVANWCCNEDGALDVVIIKKLFYIQVTGWTETRHSSARVNRSCRVPCGFCRNRTGAEQFIASYATMHTWAE